ncbi:monocarboxylate transporter 14 isoform X2 [Leptinotarsa decemlineata]|uniref:monocarboxylate transporter 14 isoform X2 n=1 Tax=Leptinotarsa decemlineata TaxID=7539 RepID=UPI003D30B6BF
MVDHEPSKRRYYVSMLPLITFGLYYGPFLASIGDETSLTATSSSIFLAVQSFTGVASGFLLKRYSYRIVGLVAATSYSIGAFSEGFSKSLVHIVISYSLLKGFGFGLLVTVSFTILNDYFDKKHNLIMGISQTVICIGTIIFPIVIAYTIEHMEFRNVGIMLGAFSLLNFPAIATYRCPRKKSTGITKELVTEYDSKSPTEALLQDKYNERVHQAIGHQKNKSMVSLLAIKHWVLDTMGLRLFFDIRYVNMVVGLAVSYNSDFNFTIIVGILLSNSNFRSSDVGMIVMVYFGFDLISRITYSFISYFHTINNRMTFLVATFIISVFRVAFVLGEGYTWKMITIGLVGLTRGFIETPLPLVISEMYKNDFSTAYSLYMFLTGCLGLIFGPITRYVKDITKSDPMIIYFYAVANFLICSTWVMEMIFLKICNKGSHEIVDSEDNKE